MNEFVGRKLGEVLAFSEIGSETFKKGKSALDVVFGEEKVREFIKENDNLKEEILSVAEVAWMIDVTLKKSEATNGKLRHMRDYYIGDDWDDPAELLEWLGFFIGAALVHWKLVEGAAETLDNGVLKELSEKGVSFNQGILREVSDKIKEIGAKKSV